MAALTHAYEWGNTKHRGAKNSVCFYGRLSHREDWIKPTELVTCMACMECIDWESRVWKR